MPSPLEVLWTKQTVKDPCGILDKLSDTPTQPVLGMTVNKDDDTQCGKMIDPLFLHFVQPFVDKWFILLRSEIGFLVEYFQTKPAHFLVKHVG